MPTVSRNDPCWCGSGKKYKKCHLRRDRLRQRRKRERKHWAWRNGLLAFAAIVFGAGGFAIGAVVAGGVRGGLGGIPFGLGAFVFLLKVYEHGWSHFE